MKQEFQLHEVYLSSLLHDIGEFYKRAALEDDKNKVYNTFKEKLPAQDINSPGHREWGAYFCKNTSLDKKDVIAQRILEHHNPVSLVGKIIKIADILSSGKDREQKDKIIDYRNIESVLSLVDIGKKTNKKYKALGKASVYKGLLDSEQPNIKKEYKILWDEFYETIKNEKDDERIYYILKEYTQNIRKDFDNTSDISLFSHLNTTAAIAVCIYRQYEEEIKKGEFEKIEALLDKLEGGKSPEDEIFCLLKGDISGIQGFIYNVDMDGALKALKGRSFYVAYILEIIARYIIKNEGLTLSNLLYCGGGHSYILLPAKSIDNLPKYQRFVDEVLYKAHSLDVAVLLAAERFDAGIFTNNNFSEIFDKVGKMLAQGKNRKNKSIMSHDMFKPRWLAERICPYCNRKMDSDKCSFCSSFESLGDNLIKHRYISFEDVINEKRQIKNVFDIFESFGFRIRFSDEPNLKSYSISKEEFDFKKSMYYIKTANHLHKNGNGVVSLDDISKISDGIKRWGILRGDVDNLGKIFHSGLKENKSIARVSTLSNELDMFFGNFLEGFIRDEFKECDVIYSGGDDFFIIGPWSKLPYLAEEINKRLCEYAGGNPNITVSMAIEIAPDIKFPIYRVAEVAGENLDRAKDCKRGNYEKNAISLMGQAVGWEEYDTHKLIKEILVGLINDKVTRNIFNVLYSIFEQNQRAKDNNEIFRTWRLVYYIAKLKERYSKNKSEIDKLINLILKNHNELYSKLESATIWADLETRC
ncbi:type III-A CRISPR-associated protein Cas10/Csm1 [Fonticella tunisiensis]|uniref:CRISPR system single-strand-specific deoxyribonuclease Cas10/Csm1 (subtype III-A) n=1 Tax=Fonticella tunisiensis TaxID=1096341 RepID=A0A4R7KBX2_9CLOT|nr:type III-A CRISPR-associated protein Cas10/Csm1 [Fonticella tunisiensis]TDT51291.1 CRISPR-associated protein Cas10/Csm1 (subtype III-A) [Fonticella tunisiensis]